MYIRNAGESATGINVSRQTNQHLILAQSWESQVGAGNFKASQQHINHGDMEISSTHKMILVIQAHNCTRIVVLYLQPIQLVAHSIYNWQVRTCTVITT